MLFPDKDRIKRLLHEREIQRGIPAVVWMVAAELFSIRWLLVVRHSASLHGSVVDGWLSVAIAGWALWIGSLGWLKATRRDAGLLFLWAMVLAGTVVLCGGLPYVGGGLLFSRFGYAALAFLSALTIHFHVIFPRKMRFELRKIVLIGVYGVAAAMAVFWLFYPSPFTFGLRFLTRAFFAISGVLAWARMFYVGRVGYTPEERWVGRWLSIVLFLGGIVPAWGYVIPQIVLGKPVISLRVAYLFEMAIPLGYFVMVERYEPWREGKPAPRIASIVAVAAAEALTLAAAWEYLVTIHQEKWYELASGLAAVLLFFPLYRLSWMLMEKDLYGVWYRRDRFLGEFSSALRGEKGESRIWRTAVRKLAEGMKLEMACGETAGGDCFCWRRRLGEISGDCPEDPEVELPVESHGETLGKLYVGWHVDGSGLGRRDRMALEAVAAMVGMALRGAMWEGVVENGSDSPLTERETEVLELAASGFGNKEIAEKLTVSEKTVVHHLEHVYSKLGAQNRAHAVAIALARGWIKLRRRGKRGSEEG